jgi:hypothetical protein
MSMDDDVGVEFTVVAQGDVSLDHAEGTDFGIFTDLSIGRNDGAGVDGHRGLADIGHSFVAKKIARVNTSLNQLPLAVEIEAEAGEVFLGPLIGSDHGKDVFLTDAIEVVSLAHDGFELDIGLINELVPVEVFDGADVLLPHFGEFLMEVTLDLAEAAGFEGGEIIGDDLRAQGRYRIREKGRRSG